MTKIKGKIADPEPITNLAEENIEITSSHHFAENNFSLPNGQLPVETYYDSSLLYQAASRYPRVSINPRSKLLILYCILMLFFSMKKSQREKFDQRYE